IESYADMLLDRAPRMEREIGTLAGAFRGMGRAAADAWDSVVEGLDHAAKRLATESPGMIGNFLRWSNMRGGNSLGTDDRPDFSSVTTSPIVDSDQAAADETWQRAAIRYATDREKLERDIAEARRLGTAAGKSEVEIQARIAAIQADHARKAKKPGGAGAVDNAGFRAQIQSVQDALRLEQNAIQNANSVLQAQYGARLVTVENYYSEQRSLVQRAASAEEDS